MGKQNRSSIKSLERAFKVIKGLEEIGSSGVSELASYLDSPPSTTYTHLNALEQAGYLVKDDNAKYSLSYQFLEIGGRLRHQSSFYKCAKPYIMELTEETGELVNLMVPERDQAVHLSISKGSNGVDLDTFPGKRIPFHTTGNGKAMLAYMPDDQIERIIERNGLVRRTENTITNRDHLFEEIDTIRKQGYAVDDEERLARLRCVGAPILTDDRRVIGGVSISGPTSQMTGERFEEFPQKVMNTAEKIEIDMEYSAQ
jgi:IclR family acetate operon transcriptional repressor